MILKGDSDMTQSSHEKIDYNMEVEDLFGEQADEPDELSRKQVDFDSEIENLFDEKADEFDELEDVSISSSVFEPVQVGLKEKKLEYRLEKSFEPQYDRELYVVDADGNSSVLPIEDLQFLAFVNIPLHIDILNIKENYDAIETFRGDSFEVRIPDDQDFSTGFFGITTNPEDRYRYIFFPHNNIKIQIQQRPIGDIFVEKHLLSEDLLQNVLRKQKQLRNLRLGSIIAKRASLKPQKIEETLQKAWQKEPDKKLRSEEKRLKKETAEKLQREKKRLQQETDEKKQLEIERLMEEEEEKLLQEQERLRKEADQKMRLETEKLKQEADEKIKQAQDQLQMEADEKLRLEEEKLKQEADEKIKQAQEQLQIEADKKLLIEIEKLKKEEVKNLYQVQERLREEAGEKLRLEEERLKKEAGEKLRLEQERLQRLVKTKLELEAEWLKNDEDVKLPTGDILIEAGMVSPQAVKQSLAIQKKMRHMKVGELAVELGYINEEQMFTVLAEKFKKRFVNLQKITPSDEALGQLPHNFIKKLEIIPIHFQSERLVIATSYPDRANLIDSLEDKLSCPFELVISPHSQIVAALADLPS